MRLCNESHSFASVANAEKALAKALARIGRTLDDTRYVIAVNAIGRYVPAVLVTTKDVNEMMALTSLGVSLIN